VFLVLLRACLALNCLYRHFFSPELARRRSARTRRTVHFEIGEARTKIEPPAAAGSRGRKEIAPDSNQVPRAGATKTQCRRRRLRRGRPRLRRPQRRPSTSGTNEGEESARTTNPAGGGARNDKGAKKPGAGCRPHNVVAAQSWRRRRTGLRGRRWHGRATRFGSAVQRQPLPNGICLPSGFRHRWPLFSPILSRIPR
jgi:hypothetical protein